VRSWTAWKSATPRNVPAPTTAISGACAASACGITVPRARSRAAFSPRTGRGRTTGASAIWSSTVVKNSHRSLACQVHKPGQAHVTGHMSAAVKSCSYSPARPVTCDFLMSKHDKLFLHNKKTNRNIGRGAMAVHGSLKDGHTKEITSSRTPSAQLFMNQLKAEIRKAVKWCSWYHECIIVHIFAFCLIAWYISL